jgi:hypothetical protein
VIAVRLVTDYVVEKVIAETIYLTWTANECLRQTFSSP